MKLYLMVRIAEMPAPRGRLAGVVADAILDVAIDLPAHEARRLVGHGGAGATAGADCAAGSATDAGEPSTTLAGIALPTAGIAWAVRGAGRSRAGGLEAAHGDAAGAGDALAGIVAHAVGAVAAVDGAGHGRRRGQHAEHRKDSPYPFHERDGSVMAGLDKCLIYMNAGHRLHERLWRPAAVASR